MTYSPFSWFCQRQMKALFYLLFARGWIRRGCCIFVSFKKGTVSSQCPPISSKNLKTLQPLQIKETEVFRGQNAGKRFKIKGKQLPSTSVQRLFSAVYRPDSLNSSKSSGGDTVRVRPPLPAPIPGNPNRIFPVEEWFGFLLFFGIGFSPPVYEREALQSAFLCE